MIPEQTLLNFPLFGDNATKVEPDNNKKSNGWQQADVVPAEWMNWEWYHASKGVSDLNKGVSSMEKEINNVLSSFGITAAEATNNQLLTAVLKLLPKFAECTTAAATEQKAITVTGDVLKAGNVYVIDMTNSNTYGDGLSTYPKLVINGGTAYPLCDQDGHYLASGAWAAGDTVKVLFTGDKFLMATRAVTDAVTNGDKSPVTSSAVYQLVSNQFNILHPIGECYTQYPGQKSPNELWGDFSTWEELNYGGAFFRTEGGAAEDFEKTLTISSISGTSITFSAAHNLQVGSILYDKTNNEARQVTSVTSTTVVVINSAFTSTNLTNVLIGQYDQFQGHTHGDYKKSAPVFSWAVGGGDVGYIISGMDQLKSDGTNGTPRAGNETRPTNMTYKIWKRTA